MNKAQIKIKLFQLDKRQKDLLPELRGKGFTIGEQELSSVIQGSVQGPKAEAVLVAIREILKAWEKEKQ